MIPRDRCYRKVVEEGRNDSTKGVAVGDIDPVKGAEAGRCALVVVRPT